jgi:hypothetical protein
MSTLSPSARNYKRLGYLALAHAVALFGLAALVVQDNGLSRFRDSWVGISTLWFLWPIVLVLHPGRSALRLTVFALLSAVLLFPSLLFYDRVAPDAFGMPDGARMNPLSAWMYFSAYRAGKAQAKKDIAAGILVIEEHGLGAAGDSEVRRILRERYNIELKAIAGCFVDETILGHEAGYNAVSAAEIDRRFGWDHVEAAREEGFRMEREENAHRERYFKDLANRISSFSSDSKIALESLRLWADGRREIGAEAEQELGQIVHAIEKFIAEVIPPEAAAFELHVSATLTPTEPPQFQSSASLGSRPAYDKIYKGLPNLPLPQWDKGDLTVSLDFKVRETH